MPNFLNDQCNYTDKKQADYTHIPSTVNRENFLSIVVIIRDGINATLFLVMKELVFHRDSLVALL